MIVVSDTSPIHYLVLTGTISLAAETEATLPLTDDRRARRQAESRGVAVAGTISVLEAAAKRQLLSLPDVIAKLKQTR